MKPLKNFWNKTEDSLSLSQQDSRKALAAFVELQREQVNKMTELIVQSEKRIERTNEMVYKLAEVCDHLSNTYSKHLSTVVESRQKIVEQNTELIKQNSEMVRRKDELARRLEHLERKFEEVTDKLIQLVEHTKSTAGNSTTINQK